MGRRIDQIRIVDIKKSKVDWELSDPEKGKYQFKGKPVYIDYKSDGAPLPDHKVQWINQNHIDTYKYDYDYELVRHQDKLYWPEGFEPNAEGWYQYKDTRLMMCPAHLYIERKKANIMKSINAARGKMRALQEEARRDDVVLEEIDSRKLIR